MLITVIWTLVGAAAGGMLGGALGDLGANHSGDIGRIFGGLVVGALIGAVALGVAGRAFDRRTANDPQRRRVLVAATWACPLLVVLSGVLFETIRTWDDLKDGGAAWLIYEVRLAPGAAAPDATAVVAEFRTEKELRKQSFPGHGINVGREGGRVVIQGSFETYKTAKTRTLRFRIGDGPTYIFDLRSLPPRPPNGYAPGYSDWQGAAQIEEAGKPARAPQPNEPLEIRYKIDV